MRPNKRRRLAAGIVACVGLSTLSGWVVSAPKPPVSICARHDLDSDACASTADQPAPTSSGAATKWHPGHYMQILRGGSQLQQAERFLQYDTIAHEENIEGVVVPMPWSQLEQSRGDYAAGIRLLEAELDKLRSLPVPKRMFVRLMDSGYLDECPATSMIPKYVSDAGGTFKTGKGCMWRRWDPTVMGYYIDMLKAYAEAFDDDPYFEGIVVLREIPLAWGGTQAPSDYSNRGYRKQLDRLMTEAVAAFEKSLVVSPTSWVGSEIETVHHIEHVSSIRGAVGNMDVCPDCDMWADLAIRGELGDTDYRGKIPLVYSVETSVLGLDAVGPDGGYMPSEIYRWANDVQRVTHLFWDRNDYAGSSGQRWPAILDLIRSNPLTNLDCPEKVAACASD
ncbi:MAG: hypothetical protein JXB36_14200 [Gammaproteobacteria bacterium]|nr:hypothetical protein [Gammaproteobacteria bacterium]